MKTPYFPYRRFLPGIFSLLLLLIPRAGKSQINYTANDAGKVLPYNQLFYYGMNPGYYGTSWDDKALANIAAGNPSLNVPGAGVRSYRVTLPDYFVSFYGFDIRIPEFNHFHSLGMRENTIFLGFPSDAHQENRDYGCGEKSKMFSNMYEPIWDNGLNGTPVNENNTYALYVYNTVNKYKGYTRFWEIMNEPDFDISANAWKDSTQSGNWWKSNPSPCDLLNMKAPLFSYIRMLRISYEVIKTLDNTAYIATGGIGYPSFLDAILRNTDNPVDGSVTPEYPNKGGAYFDVLSFHNYSMYTLRNWDNSIGGFAYHRHSDYAVKEYIDAKRQMDDVLKKFGYNGVQYPAKHFICTENNIPRKAFGDLIGSNEAQRNYIIKSLVASQKASILQYYLFVLGDAKSLAEATDPYEVMGLYQKLDGIGPLSNGGKYLQQINDQGIAFRTTSEMLRGYRFDPARTALLQLPATVDGGAFRHDNGNWVYVLWAKTQTDRSEAASAVYSFPSGANVSPIIVKHDWNYAVTGSTQTIASSSINLSASPVFLVDNGPLQRPADPDTTTRYPNVPQTVQVVPNPVQTNAVVRFTLPYSSTVSLMVYNAQGILITQVPPAAKLSAGDHQIRIPDMRQWPDGVYFGQLVTETGTATLKFINNRK